MMTPQSDPHSEATNLPDQFRVTSDKPAALAEEIRQTADRFLAVVEAIPPVHWHDLIPAEEKTLSALVQHIAWALDAESLAFAGIAEGAGDFSWTSEWLDQQNQQHANLHANDDKAASIDALRKASKLAAGRVAAITATGLSQTGRHMPGEPERSVAEWVEVCLIAHPMDHLAAVENFNATARSGTP